MLLPAATTFTLPRRNTRLHAQRCTTSGEKPSLRNARCRSTLRHVSFPAAPDKEDLSPPSVAAVAAAVRRVSTTSPVEFERRVEKRGRAGFVLPSPDFLRLCAEQLDLFRMVVHGDAVLSVFVRPAGSFVMDQLELCQINFYPGNDVSGNAECVILVGSFAIPAGLRAAEAALSKQQVEYIPKYDAVVLPMVSHPFVVGFLVAELPNMGLETGTNIQSDQGHMPFSSSPSDANIKDWEIQALNNDLIKHYTYFTDEQSSKATMISRSLAVAYILDQKAMLLQQTSWQNNIRMSHLVEQIRGSLSSIRSLSKILSMQIKRNEIAYDIIQDILLQGDNMKDALQQLQDAVYLTKANILRYNEANLRIPVDVQPDSLATLVPLDVSRENQDYRPKKLDSVVPLRSGKDIEVPMPPVLLSPLQLDNIRPCGILDVLKDLVEAAEPLANKQERSLELVVQSHDLEVAVEESALRQALSNLIEGALLRTHIGGKVEIFAARAPAGGALVVIGDDGPDMHYMTQMHSLTPFGADLFSEGNVEDNMAWNFITGLTVAREILEGYGCVIRVISPCRPDMELPGAGGTRVEIWLPAQQFDFSDAAPEA